MRKVLIVNETRSGDDETPLSVVHASPDTVLGRFTLGPNKSVVVELGVGERVEVCGPTPES